jgi:glycosyltransferase involved in cell wall biosynthesis
VIVPAFNVSLFISEALDSVFSQDFNDFEVIVVNDGSPDTDDLERVLKKYQEHIIYLKQQNTGPSGARNAALRIARGKYIALLDGDDAWLSDKLSEQVGFIQSGGYDLVYADAFLIGESPWPAGTTFMQKSPSDGEVTSESLLALRCCVLLSTVLAKKKAIIEAGMFDEQVRVAEDFDLWVRMALKGKRFGYQRQVLANYRYRAGSLSADRIKLQEGGLRVLEGLKARSDLNRKNRKALECTAAQLRLGVSLERGKLMILEGDFDAAQQLLSEARKQSKSWKVTFALVGLRTAPRTLQKLYRSRQTSRARGQNPPLTESHE